MEAQFSPSGHVPLNERTLSQMPEEERGFWETFLSKVMNLIEEAREADKEPQLTEELRADFDKAIADYDGDRYCQVNQIRGIFGIARAN